MALRNLHRNLSILLLFISSLIYGQGAPTPVPFSSLPLSTSIDSVNDRIIYLHWNGVKWTNTIISPNYFFRIAKAAAGGGVNSANYLTASNGSALINSWFHQLNRDSMMIKNGTRNCGIGQDGARSITSNMWFPNLGVFYDRGGHPVAIFNQNQSVVFDSSGNMKADFGNGLLKDFNGISQFSWSIYGVSIYTSPTAGGGDSILCYQAGTGLITKLARGSIGTNYLNDTLNGSGAKPVLITTYYLGNTWGGSTHVVTLGTIATGTWNATIISPTYGGTGVNNGSNTLTWASAMSFGANAKGYAYNHGNGIITYDTTRAGGVTGTGTTNYLPIFTGTNSLGNSTITLSGHLYNFNDAIEATQGNFGTPSATQGYMYLYNSTNNNSIGFASNAPAYNYGYVFPNYQGQVGQVLVDSAITGNLVYYKWGTASSTNYLNDTVGGSGATPQLVTKQVIRTDTTNANNFISSIPFMKSWVATHAASGGRATDSLGGDSVSLYFNGHSLGNGTTEMDTNYYTGSAGNNAGYGVLMIATLNNISDAQIVRFYYTKKTTKYSQITWPSNASAIGYTLVQTSHTKVAGQVMTFQTTTATSTWMIEIKRFNSRYLISAIEVTP